MKACVASSILVHNFTNHNYIKHVTKATVKFVHLFLKSWFDQTTVFKAIKSEEILNDIKKYCD